jgi:hypothetical protein
MWIDGERQPYRDHLLRVDHVRGYEAGYLGRPGLPRCRVRWGCAGQCEEVTVRLMPQILAELARRG